jgi:magnesium transporter
VRDISNAKQEIINFRKVIRPAARGLQRSRAQQAALHRRRPRHLLRRHRDASERIWDMLENFKEVVEALEDTNESAIAHRSNEVFRVLTAFSVIFLPLTLIASIWGMNVRVPGDGDPTAFYVVLGFLVVVLAALLALFRRRGWL